MTQKGPKFMFHIPENQPKYYPIEKVSTQNNLHVS